MAWAACGLVFGAVAGLFARVLRNERAQTPEPPPAKAVARSKKAAPVEKKPEGSAGLQLLEKLARASGSELEDLTRSILQEGDFAMMRHLWDRWIEADPERGYALITSGALPLVNPRMSPVWEYIGRWSLKDPDTAVSRMLVLERRDAGIAGSRICAALAISRPADFFRLLPELRKGYDVSFSCATAAKNLAAQDPAAAVKLLEDGTLWKTGSRSEEAPASRDRLLAAIATGWAKNDPEAAAGWARGLDEARDRKTALQALAGRIVMDQPDLAAGLIHEAYGLPEDSSPGKKAEMQAVLQKMAMGWTSSDADAGIAWLTDRFGEQGKTVAREFAEGRVPHESQAAMEYLLRHHDLLSGDGSIPLFVGTECVPEEAAKGLARAEKIADPAQRQLVETFFLRGLSRQSPQEAMERAAQNISDTPARQEILRAAMRSWALNDVSAASDWLRAQPSGPDRDVAIRSMLPVVARTEPDSALHWAAAVSEPQLRQQQIISVLQQSERSDEAAARAMLTEAAIPAAEQEAIIQKLKPSFSAR